MSDPARIVVQMKIVSEEPRDPDERYPRSEQFPDPHVAAGSPEPLS